MKKLILCLVLLLGINFQLYAESNAYVSTRFLTAKSANKVAVVAEQSCKKQGYQVSVAVTDRYGNLLAFSRDPLSGAHTISLAEDKAYTAATFQGDTMTLGKRLEALRGTPRVSLVAGGVPINVGGYLYGAVGVSGATGKKVPGDTDHDCAVIGIEAIQDALEFGE